ncbi:MAG TPA: nitrous oxide-stimulated promoter family protein [Clostridia bacterium]|jgi:hypothetical protein|nr:nitrous oxide-stimulated promoter family protein [Clostridia bacterium]
MNKIEQKRQQEKRIIKEMISLYCRKKHGSSKGFLCAQCSDLYKYSEKRIDCCPFMETKTFCSNCKVHCYKPDMREKIREVMIYSGPRIFFIHPILTLKHVISNANNKRKSRHK